MTLDAGKPETKLSKGRQNIINAAFVVIPIICVVTGLLLLSRLLQQPGWVEDPDEPPDRVEKSFQGSSDDLLQTVIVPTLDTPIPQRKSAIWCSSFQIGWNHIKKDVAKGPVRIKNAEDVAELLNRAEQSEDDLEPGMFYSAAGWANDGIADKIRKEMAEKFPDVFVRNYYLPPTGGLAYAYLRAGVKYKHSFFDNDKRFVFIDSSGKKTSVRSFGIREEDKYKDGQRESFRGQVEILFGSASSNQFAIDLCKESVPNQVVLARVPRGKTLAATVSDVVTRIPADRTDPRAHRLDDEDTLLVPIMYWRIEHHFHELEGPDKTLLNPSLEGFFLNQALQTLEFKLD
jgi:hypothetical protein